MSVGDWNHAICDNCWKIREPNKVPIRVIGLEEIEICCWCGCNGNGIFVREDPKIVPCSWRAVEIENLKDATRKLFNAVEELEKLKKEKE